MSNDKIRDLTPVDVSFSPGERPTDVKLEGMMRQVQEGLEYIENLFGDAYGESLQDENIWISNFSRDIGDRDLMSPIMTPDQLISNYAQSLTLGKNEHELDLIPVGSGASIISSSTDSSVIPSQFKVSVVDLIEEGDWTILPGKVEGTTEKNSRKLVTHSPSSGATITFAQVTSGRGSAYLGARHNVIPSVAQAESGGSFCAVSLNDAINNIYTFTLPLNETNTDELYNQSSSSLSNTAGSVGSNNQLQLPEYMFNSSGLDMGSNDPVSGQGKYFPKNIIQIYDWQEKKVIGSLLSVQASGVVANRRFEIICQFSSDTVIDTVSGQYMVVTSGTQLADMIGALQREMFFHKHSGDDMVRSISHSDLLGLRTGSNTLDRSEYYGPSSIDNNDHSMYFHRSGYTDTDTGGGGNVIRGNVLIGNTDIGDSANHEHSNLNADSFQLYFANPSKNGGSIYFDKVRDHNIPSGFGSIPASFSDTALVITGSLDDSTSLIKTTYIDGNLRVGGDVVLGTTDTDTVVITGVVQSNNMTLTPSLFSNDSTQVTFQDLSITSALAECSSDRVYVNRLRVADGDVSEPGMVFQTDSNLGIYRVAEDDLSIVTNGTDALRVNNTYISSIRNHRFEDGTVGIPSMSFNNDIDTGFYKPADGSISVSSNGTEHSRFDADGLLYTTATAARYSDLAERYASDMLLEPGDLVAFGGEKEITISSEENNLILGVVSTKPAVRMNSEAGTDDTHPYIALVGRIPCKVTGKVKKFAKLIASNIPGVAMSNFGHEHHNNQIIGIALENKDSDDVELIEVVVGKF